MDEYLGEIRMVAFNFAPVNYAFCKGQLLPISQNVALFSIIGNVFGGDGVNNFYLPDMRGRTAIDTGSATGLSTYNLGQQTGKPTNILSADHLPPHSHTVSGSLSMRTTNQPGDTESPVDNYFAIDDTERFQTEHNNTTMKPATVNLQANAGPDVGVNNMMPYLGINYIICMSGVFPARY